MSDLKLSDPFYQRNVRSVEKRGTTFLVDFDGENDSFWLAHYPHWEEPTFDVFARFCKKDKVMIDIGTWIGPTVLYNADKCKFIYGVEADVKSVASIGRNLEANGFNNVKIIPKAIYRENGEVDFGKNCFMHNSRENDSTSQIQSESTNTYRVPSISFDALIADCKIVPADICLIKVD